MVVSALFHKGELKGYRLVTDVGSFDISAEAAQRYELSILCTDELELISGNGLLKTIDESIIVPNISFDVQMIDTLSALYNLKQTNFSVACTGKDLESYTTFVSDFNKRYVFDEVIEAIEKSQRNVTLVYGVRRTGKTIMLLQAIRHLIEQGVSSNKIVYCSVKSRGMTYAQLESFILTLVNKLNIDYVFVDEFTYTTLNTGYEEEDLSIFSEAFPNKKFIFSGTNSACFIPALTSEWYGRVTKISTSYISYKEYNHLFPSKMIIDYINIGGLLQSDDNYAIEHEQDINFISRYGRDYFDTAIISNMFHAFQYFELGKKYPCLSKLYFDNPSHLKSMLFKWVQRYSDLLTREILNKKLSVADIGGMKATFRRDDSYIDVISDIGLFAEGLQKLYIDSAKLIEDKFELEEDKELISFLDELGCIVHADSDMDFVIPLAVRYGCTCEAITLMCEHFDELTDGLATGVTLEEFKSRLLRRAQGIILESIVYIDLAKKGVSFSKLRLSTNTNEEVDLILNDTDMYEIKLTSSRYVSDLRWLVDSRVCDSVHPTSRTVLYTGENGVEYHTQKEVLQSYVDFLRSKSLDPKNKDKYVSDSLLSKLQEADDIIKYKISYKNVSEFLIEMT